MFLRFTFLITCLLAFGLTLSGTANAQAPRPVGWWRFDGNADDSSGNNNHGTVVGNPQWVAGKIGGALDFDGTDDYVESGTNIIPGSGDFTIALWLTADSSVLVEDDRAVVEQGPSDASGDRIYLYSSTDFGDANGQVRVWSDPTGQVLLGPDIRGAGWKHLVLTRSANDWELYVDGTLYATASNANSIPEGQLILGGGSVDGRYHFGQIDDVRIYNTALTAEQIEAVMTGEKFPFAMAPTPEDGALYTDTWVNLDWSPGDLAVSHDVYFSDNFDDVNGGADDAYRGNHTDTFLIVGFPGFAYPDGLVPGTTYYWRVDEVNEADPNSPWTGEVWSFSIPSKKAYDPSPSDGAMFVATDVELGWAPGFDAKLHTVYLGESFEDVNNAAVGTPASTTSFAPGSLELGKTYYWRVDEFDPPATVKGDVWSFTTTLPGLGTAVMSRWENIATTDLGALKNDPRFPNNPDVTETVDEFLWNGEDLSDYGARIEGWLYVPTTGDYTFWINTDDQGELWLSTNDDPSNAVLIAQESSWSGFGAWGSGEEQSDPVTLVGGEKYYISALWKEGGGGDHCQVAWKGPDIAERTVIAGANLSPFEPVKAFGAKPANNAVYVTQTPVLQWSPGLAAASHEVYFGTDADAVGNATKASPEYVGSRQLGNEIYEPAMLSWDTSYYWRVDEVNAVNPDSPWVGSVWSFTTADFGIVENFESYNDIPAGEPGSNLVYAAWKDGFDDPIANGSTIGYVTGASMESDTVHGGELSAPMTYNNTTASISEIVHTFSPTQNWTANGALTLSLWFYGAGDNVPGQLYVKINGVQINYDGKADNLAVAGWRPWRIDLTAANTDLSRITSLAVGVQGPGATGTLLLDDIRLYAQARERITPVQPDPAGLVGHYELNQNATDSSGNGNHGTLFGNPPWVPGKIGSAVEFDGGHDYVDCGNDPSLNITGEMTISAWIYPTGNGSSDYPRIVDKSDGTGSGDPGYKMYLRAAEDYVVTLSAGGTSHNSGSSVTLNAWNHVTFIISGTQWQFELNGAWEQWNENTVPSLSGNSLFIGNSPAGDRHFDGIIDDVRIYNRALTPAEAAWLAGMTEPFDTPF